MKTSISSIVGFSDYRAILREELKLRQQHNPAYSQRAFARDLGILPHRLSEILRKRQGLSPSSAEQVATRLALSKEESAYFVDLVRMQHARTAGEKKAAKERVEALQAGEDYHAIDLSVFQCLSDWLPFAILEATSLDGFSPSISKTAKRFNVTETRVAEALKHLEKVGLIKIEPNRWKPLVSNTLTARGVPSRAVKHYHRQVMERAVQALFQAPMDRREFSSLVVAIDRRKLPQLKQRLRNFVREIDKEFRKSPKLTDVACLSLQLFFLSQE